MRTGSFALMAAVAVSTAMPASGQIADRAGQNRDRTSVVVRPGGERGGPDRGRGTGVVVVTPDLTDRARRAEYCRDADRGRRDGRHGWFDVEGRYDCNRDDRFDRDYRSDRSRRPVGFVGASLAREHVAFMSQLDLEHERWHRRHGWYPRNRGWQKSHDALHRRLERDHERWHRRLGVPFALWPDNVRHEVVPGRGRGVVVIR